MSLKTFYLQTPWGLEESFFARMHDLFERHFAGEDTDPAEVAKVMAEREKRRKPIRDERAAAGASFDDDEPNENRAWMTQSGVGVVPVMGVIAPRASMVNGMSQPEGTDTGRIARDLMAYADDPKCKGILCDIDSPGGAVTGIESVRDAMAYAKSKKPVHAYSSGMMASAAYWIGSASDRLTTARSAFLGSIGAFLVRDDTSAILEKRGIKRHVVKSVPGKGAGVDGVKITEGDLAKWQGEINALHAIFAGDVGAARRMSADQLAKVADGRIFTGADSVGLRLADATGSFEQAIAGVLAAAETNAIPAPGRVGGGNKPPTGKGFTMQTAAELRKENPEAVAQIEREAVEKHVKDSAVKVEPAATFAQLSEAFAAKDGGKDFVFEAQQKGLTISAAQAAWSARVEAENTKLKEAAKVKVEAAPPVPHFTPTDPAAAKAPDASPKTYAEAVQALKAKGVKHNKAMNEARETHPQLHAAWREAGYPKIA